MIDLTRARLAHPADRWLRTLQHLAGCASWPPSCSGAAPEPALRYRRVFRHLWEEPLCAGGSTRVVAFLGALLDTFR